MDILIGLPKSLSEAYNPSFSLKVVGVAEKYEHVDAANSTITGIPEYTTPGGPNAYNLSDVQFWTSGFFPGCLWLLAERRRLFPESVGFDENKLVSLARRWQEPIKQFAYPAENHDQGFRFSSSFGREWELLRDEGSKEVLLLAAQSLAERFNDVVGCTRSWDQAISHSHHYSRDHMNSHFLVIIDNMMNLDLLYTAAQLSSSESVKLYADLATRHATMTARAHVRPDYGTWHVVNFDQTTGVVKQRFAHQGWKDESTWSRGQAWAIYGYAQCAQWTGRPEFIQLTRKLADKFLEELPNDGVPHWDFDHPRPTVRDVSAGTIAAVGLLRLTRLLLTTDRQLSAVEYYLSRAFKLVRDTIAFAATPQATLNEDGSIDFGEDGWECILKHSTANGNEFATRKLIDHGLVYADYYLLEFGNEALKLRDDVSSGKLTTDSITA